MEPAQREQSFETRLRSFVESLDYADLQTHVEEGRGRKYIAVVTTPDFEDVNEAERQRQVYQQLYETFDDDEVARIEMVFTNTPEEEQRMEEVD